MELNEGKRDAPVNVRCYFFQETKGWLQRYRPSCLLHHCKGWERQAQRKTTALSWIWPWPPQVCELWATFPPPGWAARELAAVLMCLIKGNIQIHFIQWYSKCLLCREPQNSGKFHFGMLEFIGIKIRSCSRFSNCHNFNQSFLTEIFLWCWGLRAKRGYHFIKTIGLDFSE